MRFNYLVLSMVFLAFSCGCDRKHIPTCMGYEMIPEINTSDDVARIFPRTVADIEQYVRDVIALADRKLELICGLDDQKRTFDNTVRAFDELSGALRVCSAILTNVKFVYPEAALRDAAQKGLLDLQAYEVDHISANRALYRAFVAYKAQKTASETLTEAQQRFLDRIIRDFERNGMALPDAQLEKVKQFKKELGRLTLEFKTNIDNDTPQVVCTRAELAGLEDHFVEGLQKDTSGRYILRCDPPTYMAVMQGCSVHKTRERVYTAMNRRAAAVNESVLLKAIKLRDDLARLLGFPSYAELDLVEEMAKTPARVTQFLDGITEAAQRKFVQEIALFKRELPAGVELAPDGRFYAYDMLYVIEQYRRKHLDINNEKIAEYFPLQETMEAIFGVYEQFLGLEFRHEELPWKWRQDVQYIAIYNAQKELCGHLLLDLFPRESKYDHFCQLTVVPALKTAQGTKHLPLMAILGNFPRGNGSRPALLKFRDVQTLFHELGHMVHSLLGATDLTSLSGTDGVPNDYVELPSQMFEEWTYNPAVLKQISRHFKTGEPLSDELIKRLGELHTFDSGYVVTRQLGFARCSLWCYGPGRDKSSALIRQQMYEPQQQFVLFDEQLRPECSFGHLLHYDSRYYCYLFSQVYALDVFEWVRAHGLLNRDAGTELAQKLLCKGGGADPEQMVRDLLGRSVSNEAFYKNLGFK